jgi:superfamily II DNA or RNA helicase
MHLIVNNNYTKVVEYIPGLKDFLSYTVKEYKGYGKNKKFTITKVSLLKDGYCFLTGLLPRVIKNYSPTITDRRIFPQKELQVPELADELRPYQVKYLLEALKRSRAILQCPLGGGKTILLSAVIATLRCKTLVLVPGKDLCNQITNELIRLLPPDITVSDGFDTDVLVTLPGRLKNCSKIQLEEFKVVIMDEAHGAAASQPMDVILRTAAPYRFGFTATPTGRSDGRDLVVEGLFGEIIEIVDHEDLVDQGFLSKVRVDVYSNSFDGNYPLMEDMLIVNNSQRNNLIVRLAKEHVSKTVKEVVLILVRRTQHGKILADMVEGASYVDGSTDSKVREEVISRARNGDVRVIVATKVFAQGIDIPSITLGINAAGGKSDIEASQRFGRVTRLYGGGIKRWVDFYDSLNRTMENHSKQRMEIYKNLTSNIRLMGFSDQKKEDITIEYSL